MGWVYSGRSGGEATSSGHKTFASFLFNVFMLQFMTQALYVKGGFGSFMLLWGTCHAQNRQEAS